MDRKYKLPESLNDNINKLFTELTEQICEKYKNQHKFNLRIRHIIKTSFIAEDIAKEIFPDDENMVRDITLAALFHDLGKILKLKDLYFNTIFNEQVVVEESDGHDVLGAAIVREILTIFRNQLQLNETTIDKVYYIIRNHSNKSNINLDIASRILIESDTISKINTEAIDDIIPLCKNVKDELQSFMDKIESLRPTITTDIGIKLYEENIDIFKNYIKNIIG